MLKKIDYISFSISQR